MQKKISVGAVVVICIIITIVSSMTTVVFLGESFNSRLNELNEKYLDKMSVIEEQMAEFGDIAADLRYIDQLYREMYPGELDNDQLRNYAIKGFVAGSGDRYGFYYSPDEAEELMNSISGETDGIGINVIYDADKGCIEIISVNEDSPADKAGVKTGDYIAYVVSVDGEKEAVAEIGYDAALSRMKGKAGTKAEFTVFRDDDGDGVYDELDFVVERAHIDAVSIDHHIYEPDKTIGIIRITGFDKKTPEQFFAAVDALKAEGAEKLIFDVRYNPGGDKDAVCEILDYLVPEGPLLRTVDAEGNYTVDMTSGKSELNMPMAVVTNSGTASAGELFAAAIRDYGKGKLVGETTYGKGSMQSIIPVFD
ncbi:MAG: PDZ domain-containing protein, partial [Ruminococcaceae bacterium]|nr:PDZ domain-containing protein [Oscillospiraceae bacterium]